jgi:uncharacterized protein (TIGR02452 family)
LARWWWWWWQRSQKVAVLNMAVRTKAGVMYPSPCMQHRTDVERVWSHAPSYQFNEGCVCVHENVTIFRGEEKNGYPFLSKPRRVTVISGAALKNPHLQEGKLPRRYANAIQKANMKTEVAMILIAAAHHNCTHLVLSAFGCGGQQNPPEEVAKMFHKELLYDSTLQTSIARVTFCIQDDHNAKKAHNPVGNMKAFEDEFRRT